MYRVLYRKWRPKTFEDVVDQEAVTKTLKNEISQDRLTHAYLFVGSRGTGKTTCAKILAKAANCLHPINGNPCNECEICRGIDEESNMDVVEIDAASNNGVNEIRDLRQKITYLPTKSKYRVYIIDEVHMLTLPAFNALLKTLEEPPAHIIFILATTELHKLPATIISRCQRFDFKRISTEGLASRIKYVSQQEGFKITESAAGLIASLADGGMRDALSILDKVSSVTEDIDEEAVIKAAGLIGNDGIFALYEAIQRNDAAEGIIKLNELYGGARDFRRICEDLIVHYRNLMLIKTSKNARPLIVCPEKDYERLTAFVSDITLDDIIYKINELSALMQRMSRSASPRCDFEVEIVKLCSMSYDSQSAAPAPNKRVTAATVQKNSEKSANSPERTALEKSPSAPSDDGRSSAKSSQNSGLSGYEKLNKWPMILARLEETDKMLYAILADSQGYRDGNRIYIDSPNKMFPELIKRENNAAKLKRAVNEVLEGNYLIGLYKKQSNAQKRDPLDDIAGALMSAGVDTVIDQN